MAAKQILNMAAVEEDFFSNTAIIGVGSPLPAHKFCWLINRSFDFSFTRKPESDVEFKPAKDDIHYFSLYQYEIPYSNSTHYLYKLRSEKKALLPQIKQLDYLWLVSSPTADDDVMDMANVLRSINGIQLAQIIEPSRLKNLNHLLL